MKRRMQKRSLYHRICAGKVATTHRFRAFFDAPADALNLSAGVVIVEMDQLTPELKALAIGYFRDRQDRTDVAVLERRI